MYSHVLNDHPLNESRVLSNQMIITKRNEYGCCSVSHSSDIIDKKGKDANNANNANEHNEHNEHNDDDDDDDNYLMGSTQETFSPTVLETLMRNMTVQSCIPEVMLCLKEVEPYLHTYHPPLFTREQYLSLLTCTMSHKSLKSIRNQLLALQSKSMDATIFSI